MTNHQIAISTGLAELAHTEYQVKIILISIFGCHFECEIFVFRLEIMKMQRNIQCNYGDRIQQIQEFFCFFHPYTFNVEDMTSK